MFEYSDYFKLEEYDFEFLLDRLLDLLVSSVVCLKILKILKKVLLGRLLVGLKDEPNLLEEFSLGVEKQF